LAVGSTVLVTEALSLTALLAIMLASCGALALAAVVKLRPLMSDSPTPAELASFSLRAGLPFLLAEILALLIARGDVWVGAWAFDDDAAALYATASVLAMQLGTPVGLASMAIAPVVSGQWFAGRVTSLEALIRSVLTLATVAMVPVTALMLVFGREILGLLYGADYRGAATVLSILVLGNVVMFMFGIASVVLLMTGAERTAAKVIGAWFVVIAPIAAGAAMLGGPTALAWASASATAGLYTIQAAVSYRRTGMVVAPSARLGASVRALKLRAPEGETVRSPA
jgi:O-antigen/teichoic acid export membrane protein